MFGATVRELIFAGSGFVIACFCPAVGRKIKSWFVATDTALEARVKALEAKIVADGTAALK
jgi:hypothetical protein